MKKSIKLFALFVAITFAANTFASELGIKMANLHLAPPKSSKSSNSGKAFEGKGSKTVSLGLGMSSYLGNFGKGGYYGYSGYGYGGYSYGFWYSGTLSVQAEFGVHDYVGIGIVTGIGGRNYRGGGGVLYVPVGIFANFHFFQLIADKTGKDIHADKIDLYAGLNVGSGLSVNFPAGDGSLGGILFVGPQVGIKYFFTPKIGVYAEVGYGKTLMEAGIAFKL